MKNAISVLEREIVSITNVKNYYLNINQNYITKRYAAKIEQLERAISILRKWNKTETQNDSAIPP